MTDQTIVYCIFESDIDGDGYLGWKLLSVASTLQKAQEIISKIYPGLTWESVHPTMTKENHYTFIGTCDECSKGYNMEACNFPGDTKGWVIEAQTLQ